MFIVIIFLWLPWWIYRLFLILLRDNWVEIHTRFLAAICLFYILSSSLFAVLQSGLLSGHKNLYLNETYDKAFFLVSNSKTWYFWHFLVSNSKTPWQCKILLNTFILQNSPKWIVFIRKYSICAKNPTFLTNNLKICDTLNMALKWLPLNYTSDNGKALTLILIKTRYFLCV